MSSLANISIFSSDAVNSIVKSVSITKIQVRGGPKFFVPIRSCCPIQNHILKIQNAIRENFTHFPVIKYTI